MSLSTLLTLLGTALGIASNISKSKKEDRSIREKEAYQQDLERIAEKERKERNLVSRRAALGRAIGSKNVFSPFDEDRRPSAPKEPDYGTENILSGIGTGIGALGSAFGDVDLGQELTRANTMRGAGATSAGPTVNERYSPSRYNTIYQSGSTRYS